MSYTGQHDTMLDCLHSSTEKHCPVFDCQTKQGRQPNHPVSAGRYLRMSQNIRITQKMMLSQGCRVNVLILLCVQSGHTLPLSNERLHNRIWLLCSGFPRFLRSGFGFVSVIFPALPVHLSGARTAAAKVWTVC